jgi:hypothetical protein
MDFNGLRLEYALEGILNYISWKYRMEVVLEDNGLKEFIDKYVPKPDDVDATNLDAWKMKVAKARRILLEGVRDYIVSSLHGKFTPHEMWKTLTDLFQNNNDHRKLALKDKLRKIKMENGDSIPKYLTMFVQCRDELGSVGITVADDDLVRLSLLGLPKSWHSYQVSVNGREKLPDWERLWSDWCKRSSGGTPEMDLHQSMMMKRIVPWMLRQGNGRGINSIQNLILKSRRWICPK